MLGQGHSITIVEDREILVIGKTGVGKSNMVNHLLRGPHFASRESPLAVTAAIQAVSYTRTLAGSSHGYSITMTDSPGFFDPKLDNMEIASNLSKFLLYDLSFLNKVKLSLQVMTGAGFRRRKKRPFNCRIHQVH